jgi:hypothetical protein
LASKKLELKVGAQVMLITNRHKDKLINGSQGVLISFKRKLPQVKFTNGKILVIGRKI